MTDEFRKKLEVLINSTSQENGSDTPDFILANYLTQCLAAFDIATRARDKWWRHNHGCFDTTLPEKTS